MDRRANLGAICKSRLGLERCRLCSPYRRRSAEVCDYHIQQAVEKKRSGRSELMIGTSSLTTFTKGRKAGQSNAASKVAGFDAASKTGLLPNSNKRQIDGVVTWVLPGNAPKRPAPGFPSRSSTSSGYMQGYAVPSEDKERLDMKERKRKREKEEVILRAVLKRDDGKSVGAKYLRKAGIATGKALADTTADSNKANTGAAADGLESENSDAEDSKCKTRAFSAAAVRAIGYDPTRREVSMHEGESEEAKKRRVREPAK